MVSDVFAAPDPLAVRLLDHCRVVEAPRLLNVGRLQVGSHEPILLSAQRSGPSAGPFQTLMPRPAGSWIAACYALNKSVPTSAAKTDGQANEAEASVPRHESQRGASFSRLQVYARA